MIGFGPFELDLHSRELVEGTRRTRLQDQPFEILQAMLERPGEVVTREVLRHRLWPDGTFVDFEHSLNAAIKRLRAALGDDAENPRFVETLPRRGYRFIATLTPNRNDGRPRPQTPIADRQSRVRLAVLPFTDLSEAAPEDYFSEGLTEEMIAQIGSSLRGRAGVIARSSSVAFRGTSLRLSEIAVALRADYLLEGCVRREGDRIRITATLVEAADETHLWSETYERQLSDYCGSGGGGRLSVQAEVAARIAESLAIQLGDEAACAPGHGSPTAYQALLRGRYFWNLSGDIGLDQSIEWYQRAVSAAPALAAAHAALARAQLARGEYYRDRPRPAIETAQATATWALQLDPRQCEALVAMGDVACTLTWRWSDAEDAYARALAVNPSCVAAHRRSALMLAALGRHAEASRAADRAFELDPLCLDAGSAAAWVRFTADDPAAAIDYCRNTLDMEPAHRSARRILGAAYLASGRTGDALAELRLASANGNGDDIVAMLWLAHAAAISGARSEAERLVARARTLAGVRYVPPYHLAIAHAGLGNVDAAFAALEAAHADRDPALMNLTVEPRLAALRGDPRFCAHAARLGLSQAIRA